LVVTLTLFQDLMRPVGGENFASCFAKMPKIAIDDEHVVKNPEKFSKKPQNGLTVVG
jgi:hypothetical protein